MAGVSEFVHVPIDLALDMCMHGDACASLARVTPLSHFLSLCGERWQATFRMGGDIHTERNRARPTELPRRRSDAKSIPTCMTQNRTEYIFIHSEVHRFMRPGRLFAHAEIHLVPLLRRNPASYRLYLTAFAVHVGCRQEAVAV